MEAEKKTMKIIDRPPKYNVGKGTKHEFEVDSHRSILYHIGEVGVIIFSSVQFLSKKNNQIKKKIKKTRNRFKSTGFGSVRFF